MIIYNLTIKVDWEQHNAFKFWIEEEVLIDAANNEHIQSSKFLKLLDIDTSDGMTYCVQHYFDSQMAYNQYKMTEHSTFHKVLKERFSDKLVVFASILVEV
jgi:hypothetical protein